MIAPVVKVDSSASNTAYIGMGSNLEGPVAQVRRAADALANLPGSQRIALSPLYRNPAVGPGEQPDYVNAVAVVETTLEPHALLDALQSIENAQGRARGPTRWQPRTIDLDLLLYGDRVIEDGRLTVPHPRIGERAFVLRPLYDVDQTLEVPGLGPVGLLLERVSQASLHRTGETTGSP